MTSSPESEPSGSAAERALGAGVESTTATLPWPCGLAPCDGGWTGGSVAVARGFAARPVAAFVL